MISIIVSSYKQDVFAQFSRNIAATIGVPFEIIQVWNPALMGISEAYNQGASQARYDYLVFCHEDILFKREGWGKVLMAHFRKEDIGAVGIAGGTYKSNYPSSWSVIEKFKRQNIIQGRKTGASTPIRINPLKEEISEVAVLDGVFIATKKTIFKDIKFDEQLLKGFHGYDIDFSIAVGQKYRVVVVFNILLEHFSEGNPDREWMEAAMKVADKWQHVLPLSVNDLSFQEKQVCLNECYAWFAYKLKLLHYRNRDIAFLLWKYSRAQFSISRLPFMVRSYIKILRFK